MSYVLTSQWKAMYAPHSAGLLIPIILKNVVDFCKSLWQQVIPPPRHPGLPCNIITDFLSYKGWGHLDSVGDAMGPALFYNFLGGGDYDWMRVFVHYISGHDMLKGVSID